MMRLAYFSLWRFSVNKKNLMTAGLVVFGVVMLQAAVGCSSDDSTGSSSSALTCPAVGSKNCDKDDPVTQDEYDSCKKCESQAAAYAKCQGLTSKPACGADGKSETQKI